MIKETFETRKNVIDSGITKSSRYLLHAVTFIHDLQVKKNTQGLRTTEDVGFNLYDSDFLSLVSDQFVVGYWYTNKELNLIRFKMKKYVNQLALNNFPLPELSTI